ncbi:hypothetical protein EDC22_10322 [Tepidamorphus gemmatus]|uniref:Uncharacterized protein n=1 Tax=Tepidamorphus gemmatus TaxID=747076 RepID=A0A4R3MF72_9HYPH|nr:hypothetical protein [Tepidamorphus gemmatus]TCT11713.1 hypothetical protein EDC22_10322 [Tepidamorphus gemmatus]
MRRSNLAIVWSVTGAAAVAYALNTWIVTQGGKGPFGFTLIDDRPGVASIFGIALVAPLLTLVCLTGIRYLASIRAAHWTDRIPTIWLKEETTVSTEMVAFKLFLLIAFVFIPMAGLVHFLNKLRTGWVHIDPEFGGGRLRVWEFAPLHHDGYRFGYSWDEGVTYFPGWETTLLVTLALVAIATAVYYIWRVATG